MASYFQTRTLKSIPVLRPGLFWQKLCYHYLDQRANKKNSNPFGIRIFLFLSFSFGIETINTQTLRSSLETHTRFQTKTGQKPTSLCKHPFLLALRRWGPDGSAQTHGIYKGVPPGVLNKAQTVPFIRACLN